MQEKQRTGMNRRSFFGAFGGASTAAIASVAMLSPDAAQAYDPGEEEMRARYQDSEHVQEYYRVNRYPAPKE